ncbi:MAG TPA: hypothetical protein VMN57_07270 [Anaerolineales bacterium]|nr:hypothetical protein [Anaerolineales bacterium]
MKPNLFLSIPGAEGEPPMFDPFPGALEPVAAVFLVLLVVLVLWWLLSFQVGQVELVEIGHGHDDHHDGGHDVHTPALAVETVATAPESTVKNDEMSAGREA